MAYRCVQLSFPSAPESEPALMAGLVTTAQSMTSVSLLVKEGTEGRQSVAFQSNSAHWVGLHVSGQRRVFMSTLGAPTLYQLLWQAGERMGAEPKCALSPLPVPLTAEGLGRAERRETLIAALLMASLILAVTSGVALIIGCVWWLAG